MRIGIDARELSKAQVGGFRSYLTGLLSGFSVIDDDNEYVLYVDRQVSSNSFTFPLPKKTQFRITSRNRIVADWASMRRSILSDGLDIIHFTCNYGLQALPLPTVITLHDCICLEVKSGPVFLKGELLRIYSKYMTRLSVPRAQQIITVSDYSRRCIVKHFPQMAERVNVTHLAGLLDICSSSEEEPRSKRDQARFLLLGSFELRKNLSLVIEAFGMAKASETMKLTIVATKPEVEQLVERQASKYGISERVETMTEVDDATLRSLYCDCTAFVFPSLYEGFGLPPLEAMSCGAVVLSSDRTSMPEVLGDAALYFNPNDASALASLMDAVASDSDIQNRLRPTSLNRAASFTWKKTAKQTLDVYTKAIGLR